METSLHESQNHCEVDMAMMECNGQKGAIPLDIINTFPSAGSAIVCHNAVKGYRSSGVPFLMPSKTDHQKVLKGLNMNVPNATIYGLLGPSGCGKTTLLKCVTGCLSLDSGSITVFGHRMGGKRSGTPEVGYMPQELALYDELTVAETWAYFGGLNGLSSEQLAAQTKTMRDLLQLPTSDPLVRTLSGGQKRRVSLAVALLHGPKLAILDEPTVGLDPLLRKSIWEYLNDIVTRQRITVLITTHYIEEASAAHNVGLMLDGRLLAEASPQVLKARFASNSMETIFLKLCQRHAVEDSERSGHVDETSLLRPDDDFIPEKQNGFLVHTEISEPLQHMLSNGATDSDPSVWAPKDIRWHQFKAIVKKNTLRLCRHRGAVLLALLMPILQVGIFCTGIGTPIRDIRLNVVNEENNTQDFGALFLSHIDKSIIHMEMYDDFEEAHQNAVEGGAYGVLRIPANFTDNTISMFMDCALTTPEEIIGRTIVISLDLTNRVMSMTIFMEMGRAYEAFATEFVVKMGFDRELGKPPIKISSPLYGYMEQPFTEFIIPAILVVLVFSSGMGITSLALVKEKTGGQLERCQMTGVTSFQLVLGNIVSSLGLVLMIVGMALLVAIVGFGIPCHGSIFTLIAILFSQAVLGIAVGLAISAYVQYEDTAIMFSVGIFVLAFVVSGIVWPLEGMPAFFRYLASFAPQTYACNAVRSIMCRGWDLSYFAVQMGFVSTFVWIILVVILGTLCFRYAT